MVYGARRARLSALTFAAWAVPAAAHDSPQVLDWSFDPIVLAPLAVSGLAYALGLSRLWRAAGPGRGISLTGVAAFSGGWLVVAAALLTPLDTLGATLFSAHMIQHELLMLAAAPLLVLGRPLAAWSWALPERARKRLPSLLALRWIAGPWALVTAPVAAWVLHAVVLWLWHVPRFFEAALVSEAVHTLQHASFLAAALLFWWATLATTRRPEAHAGTVLLLFTTMLHTGALGALLTFSDTIWYPLYGTRATTFGLTALEDQQLGGLIMWVPGGTVYLVAGLALLGRMLMRRPVCAIRA